MFKVLKRQYPINAILKIGHRFVFDDYYELYSNLLDLDCDVKNYVVSIDGLKFYGEVSNTDSALSFILREYDFQVMVTKPSYYISLFGNGNISKYFSSDNNVARIHKIYSGMLYASRS